MELRLLRYFLAVAREESITLAAKQLHITQPTLSRQLIELEQSLGVTLFVRGKRKHRITLTEEGIYLKQRAEEIITLVDRTQTAFETTGDLMAGDIYLCVGETEAIRLLARAVKSLQMRCPHIRFHISSGDRAVVDEQLKTGLIDFGLLLGSLDGMDYDYLTLPIQELWGVLMRRDDPLAQKESIHPQDLWDKQLIWPRQTDSSEALFHWIRRKSEDLKIITSYSLVYNASLLTDEGLGYTVALDGLINTSGDSSLCFRPLEPKLEMATHIVWNSNRNFTRAAASFLEEIRKILKSEPDESF